MPGDDVHPGADRASARQKDVGAARRGARPRSVGDDVEEDAAARLAGNALGPRAAGHQQIPARARRHDAHGLAAALLEELAPH